MKQKSLKDNSEKTSVALSSVFASAILTILKLIVGLLTGSLGILSEAAHSLLDFIAAGLTYFAVRISDTPEDTRHPYGHAKIESITALIETGLLFLTSIWIIKESITRLLFDTVIVKTTWYALAVIIISIIIDYSRVRALSRVAKKTQSQALEADALHFRSDIYSSLGVLIGLIGNLFGYFQADIFAALGVALIVSYAGYELGKRTLGILLDEAPAGIAERIVSLIDTVPGIAKINRIRVRLAGRIIFIDLQIYVSRILSTQKIQQINTEITQRIRTVFSNSDLTIQIQPLALDNENLADQIRLITESLNVPIHYLQIQRLAEKIYVSFDLEIDGSMTIKEAHNIAETIEKNIHIELGPDIEIESHLDPRRLFNSIEDVKLLDSEYYVNIEEVIKQEAKKYLNILNIYHIQVRVLSDGLHIAFHCCFSNDMLLWQAHEIAHRLECQLMKKISQAKRILIYTEPINKTNLIFND